MKKIITLTLETEIDDDESDAWIERDLMAEISCCCNHYELQSITVEEATNNDG